MGTHELADFVKYASEEIASEYQRILKRTTEDPGTAGDQGEENWARLLKEWFPTFQIVTKGRILNIKGLASPQLDVIILKPEYPSILLDKKLYLAGGVIAAFECKNTLKSAHLAKFFENSVKIKSLTKTKFGTPYDELQCPILYGLLSHSHSWKSPYPTIVETVEKYLKDADREFITHPYLMPDVICVADLASWSAEKHTYLGPLSNKNWHKHENDYGVDGCAFTGYISHSKIHNEEALHFSPIGALLTNLLRKLSWTNPNLSSLADYFTGVNIQGAGHGQLRQWDFSIYSEKTRSRILSGNVSFASVIGNKWSMVL